MPIKNLSTFVYDWTVKARVIKKFPIKTWQKEANSGKLMNIEIVDSEGTAINCTLFNDAVDKFADELEEQRIYVFSKGTIKMSQKRYTSIPHDYCINFDKQAIIERYTGRGDDIAKTSLSFVPLDKLASMPAGKQVDLLVVLHRLGSLGKITVKSTNEERARRPATLIDASGNGGTEIEATLWGVMSELPLVEGRVIGIKGAKVSEFGGRSLNLSVDHADIFDKDQLDEA